MGGLCIRDNMPKGIYIRTKEHNEKIRVAHLGKRHTEDTKRKMSKVAKKRGVPWLIGKPWSEVRRSAQENFVKKPVIKNGKEYSSDWDKIRKEIYKIDNWICQECKCKCHNTTKQKIQCHHIDYNEKNNNFNNLITLCAVCHAKTNYRRNDWTKYYKNKVKENLLK